MGNNKNDEIGEIKYGELHYYYPLKIKKAMPYSELIKVLANSSLIFTDEIRNKIMNKLGQSLADMVKKFNDDNKKKYGIYMKMDDYDKYTTGKNNACIKNDLDDLILEFDSAGENLKLKFKSYELEQISNRLERLVGEEKKTKGIYGDRYFYNQSNFLLFPCKVTLYNNKTVWMNCILYIYSNSMAILKIEIPILNVDTTALKEFNTDLYIKEIYNTFNYEVKRFKNIEEYVKSIVKVLEKDLKTEVMLLGGVFRNLILVDYEGMPKSIKNIPNSIQEDMFKIICAPVNCRENDSFKNDAIDYLNTHSYISHGVGYFIKSMGGCLSTIDRSILDYYIEPNCEMNFDKKMFYYNGIASSLSIDIEFCIIMIMIKRMINELDCIGKINNPKELLEIRSEYDRNIILWCEMSSQCFGSVYDQYEKFESMMPYYLKERIINKKLKCIDEIIEQQLETKNQASQKFISICGLIFSVMFGLKAIHDALAIIKKCFNIIDIPYVTIPSVSFILWMVLNIFIVSKFLNDKFRFNIKIL